MKTCRICRSDKEEAEFYRKKDAKDGLDARCKQCHNTAMATWRNQNPEYFTAVYLKQKDDPRYRERVRKSVKRWQNKNERKTACHQIVRSALRSGKIARLPCEMCGSLDSDAHHEDYDFPLTLVWLCPPHHKRRHIEMTKLGIKP